MPFPLCVESNLLIRDRMDAVHKAQQVGKRKAFSAQ